jgi:hypothetical protein
MSRATPAPLVRRFARSAPPFAQFVAWDPFADLLDAFVGTGVYERRTSQFDFVQGRTGRTMFAVRMHQTSDRFVVDSAHNKGTSLRGDAGYG